MKALTFDDEVDTGGSMLVGVTALKNEGVTEVYACATHGVLSGGATTRVVNSLLEELVLTDTIPLPGEKLDGKITVLSVAALLGEAIRRIHEGQSVGEMFE